jgi:hypothetical protein
VTLTLIESYHDTEQKEVHARVQHGMEAHSGYPLGTVETHQLMGM